MQTAKANSKSKQSGKTAVRTPAVSEAVAAQAQDPVAAGSPDMKPAEPQATDIGAVNPVAETSPAEQPAAHPETDVRLLDLNKIVNSTYNPRKNFREDTLLELAESIKQSGVLQPICVRPRDEGFEIVYGERRYWAAAMAGLKFIPALMRELSDAEAEDAAITENLQREDVRPREEAAAYKRALQSGRHTIESLVGKFGKSEAYIRSRLKLCELIDALAGMLDKEDISVGVATEIAKYPADIQQEVYDDHFAEGCYSSWKTARIKEIARRLYERYMTKLESYNFDKTECLSCQHNTANQVLFKDECAGGCAGCQNRECMIRKNNEFLVQKAVKLLKDDPRTTLATDGETPAAVLEALEKEGYHVEELEYSVYHYDKGPQMPDAPQAEEFESEEEFSEAQEEYEAEMAAFAEETQQLEFDISEGRVRKYAVIGNLDIEFRYEEIEDEEREMTVNEGQDDEHKVFVTVVPPSPLEGLLQQERRYREICYEHITTDMKQVFLDVKVANKPLQKGGAADVLLRRDAARNERLETPPVRFPAQGGLLPDRPGAVRRGGSYHGQATGGAGSRVSGGLFPLGGSGVWMYGRNAPDGNDVPLRGYELHGAEPEGAAGVSESLRASQSPSSGTDRRFAGKSRSGRKGRFDAGDSGLRA